MHHYFYPLSPESLHFTKGKAYIFTRLTSLFRDAQHKAGEQNSVRKGLSPAANALGIFCTNLHFCTGPPSIALGSSVKSGTEKPIGMHDTVPTSPKRKSLESHSYFRGARLPDLPVYSSLRPVCHGSMHSSQRSLLLPEHWSPLPASYCLSFPTPIKLSQLAGLETGEDRKESGRGGEIRGRGGLSAPAALLLPVKLV